MIPPLQLHRPDTLAEAVDLLERFGENARIHAGGTELVLMLREGFLTAGHLVDIKGTGLGGIRIDEPAGQLILGATSRHNEIAADPLVVDRLAVLARLEGQLANQRVRNAGTIGGNLAFAEPHADPPALLVAAGAELRVERAGASRTVPLPGWIRGPFEVDLEPGEILTEVRIPLPGPGTALGYARFRFLERPSVTMAARLELGADSRISEAVLVAGCLGGAPQVLEAAGRLRGQATGEVAALLPALAADVAREAQTASDQHGPEDYKRHLAGVLADRAIREALAQLEPVPGDPGEAAARVSR